MKIAKQWDYMNYLMVAGYGKLSLTVDKISVQGGEERVQPTKAGEQQSQNACSTKSPTAPTHSKLEPHLMLL